MARVEADLEEAPFAALLVTAGLEEAALGAAGFFSAVVFFCVEAIVSSLMLQECQDQRHKANGPAVIGKGAELALGGDHLQKADAGIAGEGCHRNAH